MASMVELPLLDLLDQPSIFTFLLAAFSLILGWLIVTGRKTNKHPKQLPAPWKLPIIGNLHQLGAHPHRSLRDLAQKHGPFMLIHLGSVPHLVVSTADAAREVLKTHDLAFSGRTSTTAAKTLLYDCKDVAVSPYGDYWRQARKICVLHLLTATRLRLARGIREEEVGRMLNKIKRSAGPLVNVSQVLLEVTNNVTAKVAVGRLYWGDSSTDDGGSTIQATLAEFLDLLGAFNIADFSPWLAWVSKINGFNARLRRNAKELDKFLEDVVDEHIRKRAARVDADTATTTTSAVYDSSFVDVLLSILESGEGDPMLDRDSIKALILDMFSAGTLTTSTILDWTMTELIKHPSIMEKVKIEVSQICGFNKALVNEDDISKMTYLKLVIKEVLRLHPPFPLLVPREAISDVYINGYHVPKGMRVMINAWAISTDPINWERPEMFWPDRFINNDIDFKGLDFEFIPFGAGRRGCPGILFATQLIELVVANILYHFDWDLPEGMSFKDLDMTEASGLSASRMFSLSLKVGSRPPS